MKDVIAALYEYGVWANDRLLAKAATLSEPQLSQRLTAGADPILATFVHLAGADVRWFARWRGEEPPPIATLMAELSTLDAVRRRWAEICPVRRAYVDSLDAAALREPIRWVRQHDTVRLPRWQAMVQCANHGTQHRSEIAAMLTDLGHSPGDLDFVYYCLEPGGPQGAPVRR